MAPTLVALRQAESKATSQRDWLFVRLFNQERSMGWASNNFGGNHEYEIIGSVDLLAIVSAVALRRYRRRQSHPWTTLALCLFTVPAIVFMFFRSGKMSVLPHRDGLVVEDAGCCSQALLFNRRHVASLIAYLRHEALQEINSHREHLSEDNYDLRTKRYARDNGLDMLSLYPMQVQHMGLKSSVGTSPQESQAVWSIAFEDILPEDREMRHQDAMVDF